MNSRIRRRQLLSVMASSGMGLLVLRNSRSARAYAANEKLRIAAIGVGGRGAANLSDLAGEQIAALCDVDEQRAAPSLARFPQAKVYHDYRRLLQELDQRIDAVVVSAANHIHAPASVTAMRMGKHAYCEKPLSHSVYEARVAARVATEKKVATQMGTQIHATDNFRRIVELLRGGAIGPVRECHCWLAGSVGADDRPKDTPPIPAGLEWDLWLGPAPYRPYHPCYVPHGWHSWWDFGGGLFGNMGCHYFDLAFWALDLRHPTTIVAEGPPPNPEGTPRSQHVRYEFAARGDQPPVTLTWTHGSRKPALCEQHQLPNWAWGAFVGSEGMLLVSYSQRMLWPQERFADYRPPAPTLPPSPGHHQEWIAACKSGRPTTCNFDYSGAVTETVLLGNVAFRMGRKLQWDGANMKFTNCPEAEKYLRREYREGWTL